MKNGEKCPRDLNHRCISESTMGFEILSPRLTTLAVNVTGPCDLATPGFPQRYQARNGTAARTSVHGKIEKTVSSKRSVKSSRLQTPPAPSPGRNGPKPESSGQAEVRAAAHARRPALQSVDMRGTCRPIGQGPYCSSIASVHVVVLSAASGILRRFCC